MTEEVCWQLKAGTGVGDDCGGAAEVDGGLQTADCSCCRVATGSAAAQTAHTHTHKRTTQQILGDSTYFDLFTAQERARVPKGTNFPKSSKRPLSAPPSFLENHIITRPCILCVTHQSSRKMRNYSVG